MATQQETTHKLITESPSRAVVEAVAEYADTDPLRLSTPLYDVVDPEALDRVVESAGDEYVAVSFGYEDYVVTIENDRIYVEESAQE